MRSERLKMLNEAAKANGGRVPPRLVFPSIVTTAEMDAYCKEYRAQGGKWTPADLAAEKVWRRIHKGRK